MVSFCHGAVVRQGRAAQGTTQSRDSDAGVGRSLVPIQFLLPVLFLGCFPLSAWPFHSLRLAAMGIVLTLWARICLWESFVFASPEPSTGPRTEQMLSTLVE